MSTIKQWIKIISSKHAIFFAIAVSMITLLISALFNWDESAVMGWDKLAGDILITFFCICLISVLDFGELAGLTKKGLGKGILLGIPFIIIGVLGAVIGNADTVFTDLTLRPIGTILLFTANMFMVGVNEEIMMRGLILNCFLRKYGSRKRGVLKSVLISSFIFGVIHLPNIFFMNPVDVLVQTINAAAAGVLFAVMFIISKNLWANIIIHMLVDWLALFIAQCFAGGGSVLSMNMTIAQGSVMVLMGSVPPCVIAALFGKVWKLK